MAFTQVTVTGTFQRSDGSVASGAVTFTPVQAMRNGTIVVTAPITVYLNESGQISVSLAATTDPGTTPTGNAYEVVEYLTGQPVRRYLLAVPYNQGSINITGDLNMSALASEAASAITGQQASVGATSAPFASEAASAITAQEALVGALSFPVAIEASFAIAAQQASVTVSGSSSPTATEATVGVTGQDATAIWSGTSAPATAAAFTMAALDATVSAYGLPWVNRTTGVAARNGTTTHTITFSTDGNAPFTPTNGRLLVLIVAAAVTHTWPGGWTERLDATANSELSVATITASSTTSVTITHSGSNYPMNWVAYEFASGSTWVNGVDATAPGNDDTNPAVTGLPGTPVCVFAGISQGISNTGGATVSATWSAIEDVDSFTDGNGTTDGVWLGVAYQNGVTATSSTITHAMTNGRASGIEQVTFALAIPPVPDRRARPIVSLPTRPLAHRIPNTALIASSPIAS